MSTMNYDGDRRMSTMNYDRRIASNPQFPTLAEAVENAFQSWCLSVVLYGLRDEHDLALDNGSMQKAGKKFSIEVLPRDEGGRPDPTLTTKLTFTLNGDKIKVDADNKANHWSFDDGTDFNDAAADIAKYLTKTR